MGLPSTVSAATLGLALLVPLSLPAQAAQAPDALKRAAETITVENVSRHIRVIADDSMRGRMTPSRGLELTARYVAEQFKQFGLKPGGDNGTWIQNVPTGSNPAGTQNAVGILEGSDPKLKQEYIVILAHMDHIGDKPGSGFENWRRLPPPPPNDSIYNGADDNASGTTGVIELARAFSQAGVRPRRSLIFLGVSGEEGGLLGTSQFLRQPPVPLEQLVAAFNMDMIGRLQKRMILIKGGQYSDLLEPFGRVVPAHPELRLSVVLRTDMTEGSDHAAFAKKKIPILFFYDGGAGEVPHPDYHTVTDTPEKITADATADVLRLVFYIGQEVANANQRPKWNEKNWENRTQNGDGNAPPPKTP